MTLTDTGPLVALTQTADPRHKDCKVALQALPKGTLLTTWPCFTEAMYLIGRGSGIRGQLLLWRMRNSLKLAIYDLSSTETDRMHVLMNQYHNVPMDLADASLIAVAETRGLRKLFTLDGDFHIYRLADGSALQTVP